MIAETTLHKYLKFIFKLETGILMGIISLIAGGSILLYKVNAQASVDEKQDIKIENTVKDVSLLYKELFGDIKEIKGILQEMRRENGR
jgi:hypothetical protein